MKKTFTLSLALCLCILTNAKIIYVNQLAAGNENGSSWNNAFRNLQKAFDVSEPNDEIWVAKGVYKPTKIFDVNEDSIYEAREATFKIPDGILLYGGFIGNETMLEQQDGNKNLTILSGDIDNNDNDPNSNGVIESINDIVGKNAYHVVTTIGLSSGTYISGFVITGGAADSESLNQMEPNNNGGGWYNNEHFEKPYLYFYRVSFIGNKAKNLGGAIFFTAPYSTLNSSRILNCNFISNKAHYGGAIYAGSSLLYQGFSLSIENCSFSLNEAAYGGALHLLGDHSYIYSSSFFKNKASKGGAIYLKSPESFIYGSSFNQNEASYEGGAVGVYSNFQETAELGLSRLSFINCAFYKNSAFGDSLASGGAIINKCEEGMLQLSFVNTMFYENTAQNKGGAIANFADLRENNPEIKAEFLSNFLNCTFSKNSAGKEGGAIFNYGSNYLGSDVFKLELTNCILWNDSATTNSKEIFSNSINHISFSLIQNSGGSGTGWDSSLGVDRGYNLDVDPLFEEIMFFGLIPGVTLSPNSPAINKGKNVYDNYHYSTDLLENTRIQQNIVDMGAIEVEGLALAHAIIYVDHKATGANNGSNWNDSFTSLTNALSIANTNDEIWVAQGVYKPTTNVDIDNSGGIDPREATFYISRGIKIYGGFAGTETSLAQRNFNLNPTILSGDIDNNDLDPDSNAVIESVDDILGKNAFHVVYINTKDSGLLIDGFFITAGSADSRNIPDFLTIDPNSCGGGIYYQPADIEGHNFAPFLKNITLIGNLAEKFGGAYYNESVYMQTGTIKNYIQNCKFNRNQSKGSAGAFFLGSIYPHCKFYAFIKNCEFFENEARHKGGAIYLISDFSFIDSTLFIANKVLADNKNNDKFSGSGGAVFLELTNAVFDNCIFEKNVASGSDAKSYAGGGAIFNYSNNGNWAIKWGSEPVFKNCYFQKNVAGGQNYAYGGAVNNYSEDAELITSFINCMFYKNGSQNSGGACANIESYSLFGFSTAFANCSFISNHAGNKGGALFNQSSYFLNLNNFIHLENSILWNNTAMMGDLEEISSVSFQDDIEEPSPGMININNCLVKKCGGTIWNNDIGTDGGNNLDEDPFFILETNDKGLVNALLSSSSPAINVGNNSAGLLVGINKDILGNTRTINLIVDMGAFEFQGIVTKQKSMPTASNSISIYPIPANEFLMISSQSPEIGSIEIYNLKGQMLIKENLSRNETRVDLKGNNPGLYLIKVISKNGTELDNKSFVIQ